MKQLISEIGQAMKLAHLALQRNKELVLKKYVNRCATKIQKVWRGFYTRMVISPVTSKIRKNRGLLVALAKGWRVRRIMRTKEVVMRIEQIVDFQKELRKGNQEMQ